MRAVRDHFGGPDEAAALDPDLEARLTDDSPEDKDYVDVRRRWRRLLEIWAGRKSSERNVHTVHCCEVHGCKYGDDWCPVATKKMTQHDLCERCEDDLMSQLAMVPAAEAYARGVTGTDADLGNFIMMDGKRIFLASPDASGGDSRSAMLKAQRVDLVWAIRKAYLAGVVGG